MSKFTQGAEFINIEKHGSMISITFKVRTGPIFWNYFSFGWNQSEFQEFLNAIQNKDKSVIGINTLTQKAYVKFTGFPRGTPVSVYLSEWFLVFGKSCTMLIEQEVLEGILNEYGNVTT